MAAGWTWLILIVVLHVLLIGVGVLALLMALDDNVKSDDYRLATQIMSGAGIGLAGLMAVWTFALIFKKELP